MVLYVGVDPGKGGGIAVLNGVGAVLLTARMPETERDLLDLLVLDGPAQAVVEQVHAGVFAKPGQRMGVKSAFSFGKGYGGLLMALTAAQIPFSEVSPLRWQTALQCRTRGDKNVSKRRAQQLFPDQRVTHATADALLLARYAWALGEGKAA